MKIAMRSGALNQLYEPLESLHEAVAKMAEDALMSGQGNSGGCGPAFHLDVLLRCWSQTFALC